MFEHDARIEIKANIFIAFFTLVFVLCIGVVEKLFFSVRAGKNKEQEK